MVWKETTNHLQKPNVALLLSFLVEMQEVCAGQASYPSGELLFGSDQFWWFSPAQPTTHLCEIAGYCCCTDRQKAALLISLCMTGDALCHHSLPYNELQSPAGEFQWRAPRLCWWSTSKGCAADVLFLEGGVTSYVTLQSRLKIGLHSLCHVAQRYVRTCIFRKFLLWAERVKNLAWFAGCWLCPDLSF